MTIDNVIMYANSRISNNIMLWLRKLSKQLRSNNHKHYFRTQHLKLNHTHHKEQLEQDFNSTYSFTYIHT